VRPRTHATTPETPEACCARRGPPSRAARQALREWQAFHDCRKTIDDFLEQLPLFQQLAHKAMRPRWPRPAYVAAVRCTPLACVVSTGSQAHGAGLYRHWAEVMRVTGAELNLADDTFKLAHLLACGLLAHHEEVRPRRRPVSRCSARC